MKDIDYAENYDTAIPKKQNLHNFLLKNFSVYENLEKDFQIYNKKWNLDKFSQEDFELFLLFSGIQIYFKYYRNLRLGYVAFPSYIYEILNQL